jgi:hypothetical protein
MSVNRPTGHAEGKGEPLVAVALASGATYAEAASAGGVSLATVKKRMVDGAYRARVQRLRAELLEQSLGVLSQYSSRAAKRLVLLMNSSSDMVAQKAARSVIEMALRMRRETDLDERMATLERQIERYRRDKQDGGGRNGR